MQGTRTGGWSERKGSETLSPWSTQHFFSFFFFSQSLVELAVRWLRVAVHLGIAGISSHLTNTKSTAGTIPGSSVIRRRAHEEETDWASRNMSHARTCSHAVAHAKRATIGTQSERTRQTEAGFGRAGRGEQRTTGLHGRLNQRLGMAALRFLPAQRAVSRRWIRSTA